MPITEKEKNMKTKTELFKQFDKDILDFYKEMVISLKENHNKTPDNQSEECMSIEDYTVRAIWLNKAIGKLNKYSNDIEESFYLYGLALIKDNN